MLREEIYGNLGHVVLYLEHVVNSEQGPNIAKTSAKGVVNDREKSAL